MAWSQVENWIKVGGSSYYETRQKPGGSTEQKRRRYTVVYECRGITQELAESLRDSIPAVYSNGSIGCEVHQSHGGNGWTATKTLDYASGDWIDGTGSFTVS